MEDVSRNGFETDAAPQRRLKDKVTLIRCPRATTLVAGEIPVARNILEMSSIGSDFPDGVGLGFWLSNGEAKSSAIGRPTQPPNCTEAFGYFSRGAAVGFGKNQAIIGGIG